MGDFMWALIPRGDLLDLSSAKPLPIALFRSEEAARGHGKAMYGSFFEVKQLEQKKEQA